ncbi:MAG: hypothetical protein M1820_010365 [Bogoriella megaspora]|nr:MAG: hypothetical protein M1820_010365 [Bogoriella megaspora]
MREEMLRIIRENGTVLLKMRNYGVQLEISLVPKSRCDKYIAISHVWSDGMGNYDSNSLPRCHLENLHLKLSEMTHEEPRAAGNELLDGEKPKVIGQMSQIYEDADFVFVLDSELESIDNRPLSKLEIAFRTLNSNWMRRRHGFGHCKKDTWQRRAMDEPLCLATLFNLDARQIAEVKKEENNCVDKRMSILWNLIGSSTIGIPKSILFHTGRKLLVDGFRWAPASLLGQVALPLAQALFAGASTSSGSISYSGLCVRSKGVLFSSKWSALRCLKKYRIPSKFSNLIDSSIFLRDSAEGWFFFGRHFDSSKSQVQTQTGMTPATAGRHAMQGPSAGN